MNKINILVLGVSSNVTQSIILAIKNAKINCNLFGACVLKNSIGKYLVDNFELCPYANTPQFIEWLEQFCITHKIHIVFSGVEENIIAISNNLDRLTQITQTKFVVGSADKLAIANDKYLTCEWLKTNHFNYPKYSLLQEPLQDIIDKLGYPLIAKPRNGKSSIGIIKITSPADLQQLSNLENYVIEEYIGTDDNEYTVGIYNNKHGKFQDLIIMKRMLKSGTTVMATTDFNPVIYNSCKEIAEKFAFEGAFNIQLRYYNNIVYPFEFNARFSGSTSIRNLLGFNDIVAAIHDYIYDEQNLSQFFTTKPGTVIRYYTEQVVDAQ